MDSTLSYRHTSLRVRLEGPPLAASAVSNQACIRAGLPRGLPLKVADFEHPIVRWRDWTPTEFEGATFVAFVDIASIRYDGSGQLTITLTVPAEHVEAARDVRWAAHRSVPRAVRMEPWKPYVERVEEDERELAEVFSRRSKG
jgi:hypothetical protein